MFEVATPSMEECCKVPFYITELFFIIYFNGPENITTDPVSILFLFTSYLHIARFSVL